MGCGNSTQKNNVANDGKLKRVQPQAVANANKSIEKSQ